MPDQSRSPRPTDKTTGKRATKTQAERSAATRELLLAAAINCLFEYGYGPTTTTLVASVAGVSRGAMLHQFPTKADLMIFVVEATFADEILHYRELLGDIDDRHERLLAYPAAVWRIMGRPEGVAVLEILQGSRSDPALAHKLAPVQERIEAAAVTALTEEFQRPPSLPLMQLIVAVARGLAIGNLISEQDEDGRDALSLFQQLLRSWRSTGEARQEPAIRPEG